MILKPQLLDSALEGRPQPPEPCALVICWAWCSVEWGRVGCGCAGNPTRSCRAQFVCPVAYCGASFPGG